MRQINDRLDAALKSHIFDLIEEQGEDHRNQHIQKKLATAMTIVLVKI